MALNRARRSAERGAALFIVVMVVVLLTAIGSFAVRATSLAQLGSGYSRRAASAFYLAELAANLRTASISNSPDAYRDKGRAHVDSCRSETALLPLLQVGATKFCVVMDGSMAKTDAFAANSSLAADPEGFFGAMGRPDVPPEQIMNPDIRVEATDHGPAPQAVAGMAINGTSSQASYVWQDTLTATGRVLPPATGVNQCTAAVTRASESQQLRGFVVYTTTTP
jgi:hypothetical protein